MNAPSSFPVETLWHTNWGFCVRTVLAGQTTAFFLDSRIPGSHRTYVEPFIHGSRREHEDTFNKIGTGNQLVPGVIAQVKTRIISTGDDIPLAPEEALSTVQRLWNARVERAKREDRAGLEEYRDRLCEEIRRVITGELSSIVAIEGILGVCAGLSKI